MLFREVKEDREAEDEVRDRLDDEDEEEEEEERDDRQPGKMGRPGNSFGGCGASGDVVLGGPRSSTRGEETEGRMICAGGVSVCLGLGVDMAFLLTRRSVNWVKVSRTLTLALESERRRGLARGLLLAAAAEDEEE